MSRKKTNTHTHDLHGLVYQCDCPIVRLQLMWMKGLQLHLRYNSKGRIWLSIVTVKKEHSKFTKLSTLCVNNISKEAYAS